jgi:hypothetical protein
MVSASNSQSTNPKLPFAGTIFAVFIIIYQALQFAIGGVISLFFPTFTLFLIISLTKKCFIFIQFWKQQNFNS